MKRRRILLANTWLHSRTGSETHLRDHALEFLWRGHAVLVYSPRLGPLAQEITEAGGEVHSDLAQFSGPPDVVLGNTHLQTMQALLYFRNAVGISFCHDAVHWGSRSPLFPRVQRYVAVDWNCRERIVRETRISAEDIPVVHNTVALPRFPARGPLPAKPASAVIFSNYARPHTYVPAIRAACERAGLRVETAGAGMGTAVEQPGSVLGNYDVVFGKARCALEALAVGCHVILCDERGLGPAVTPENFDHLRRWNFGARVLTEKVTPSAIAERLAAYNPSGTAALQQRVRKECTIEQSAGQLLALIEETLAAFNDGPAPRPDEELAAAAEYLVSFEDTIDRIREHEANSVPDGRLFLPRSLSRLITERPALRQLLRQSRDWLARHT